MSLLAIFRKYRSTLKAVRRGEHLWRLSDQPQAEGDYLSAAVFNRVQNLVSTLVALPVIVYFAGLYEELELHVATNHLGCDRRDLENAWFVAPMGTALQIAIVVLTPSAMAFLAARVVKRRYTSLKEARSAYLYLNAAFTPKSKSLLIILLGAFWAALGWWLLMENIYAKTGYFFPGADEEVLSQWWQYMLSTRGPAAAVVLAMLIPLGFYARFLGKFAQATALSSDGTHVPASQARYALPAPILISLTAGAVFFLAALVVPFLARMAGYMAECGTLSTWLYWNMGFEL